jgi:hypothetical protein
MSVDWRRLEVAAGRQTDAIDPEPTNRDVRCQVRGEEGAYQRQIGSRARATLFRVGPAPPDGWACQGLSGSREGSGAVVVRTLIYLKPSSDQRWKSVGALLEHESRLAPERSE